MPTEEGYLIPWKKTPGATAERRSNVLIKLPLPLVGEGRGEGEKERLNFLSLHLPFLSLHHWRQLGRKGVPFLR